YELRRVWHVVATLKPGQRHIYTPSSPSSTRPTEPPDPAPSS
ncbi:MAG: DUF1329 domain-containing protein, partial [Starkeya sp.]|nr:DUF1329 domain-containing protein [Starkeya sp.]